MNKIYQTSFTSKIGVIYVASTKKGVCKITIPGQTKKEFIRWLHRHYPHYEFVESTTHNKKVVDELQRYFDRKLVKFKSNLDYEGTTFQQRVWNELKKLPYGSTTTYKAIATRLGMENGFQAVGGAVGSNPIPIIVPCHRVIGTNKKLTGYAAGLKTKELLLRLEGAIAH
jgi:O-6-methylguanine DNA methyltransferase